MHRASSTSWVAATVTFYIPAPVLPAARLTLRRFSGQNSLNIGPIDSIFLAMGRGDKGTYEETSRNSIGEVTEEKSTAASGSAGKSTGQNGQSSSQEASSTAQDCRY